MKRFTLTLSLFCACVALAYAGPEPISSGKEMKQVAPVPMQTSCFQGWYFGIHGGAVLSNFDSDTDAFEETFAPRGGSESAFDSSKGGDEWSGEGGLHAGYNWVFGHWVFGLEADIQGSQLRSTSDSTAFLVLPPGPPFVFTTEVRAETQVNWYATGRLRLGYTLGDRFMLFATGGGAGGGTEFNTDAILNGNTPVGLRDTDFTLDRDNSIRGGWTAGGGIEFCLMQHWTLSFMYLYTDLGSETSDSSLAAVSTQGRRYFGDTHADTDFRFHVFQGGLTFHF